MSLIDTYQFATGGQNLVDTYILASNGILIDIQVTPIPPRPGGGGSTYGLPSDKKKEKDKKKITVTVTMPDGIKYTESMIVGDKPNLTAKDVQVEVLPTNDRPKIKISF